MLNELLNDILIDLLKRAILILMILGAAVLVPISAWFAYRKSHKSPA